MNKLYLFPGCSPYIGGAETLFHSIANRLKHEFEVHVLLQPGACKDLFKLQPVTGVTLHNLSTEHRFRCSDKGVLLCGGASIGQIPDLLYPSQTKLVVWPLHTLELFMSFTPFVHYISTRFGYKFLKKYVNFMASGSTGKAILDELNNKNGLIFMDYNTLACSEYILGIFGKVVPLMVNFKDQIREKKENAIPRYAWIGRLDSFKIEILSYLMRHLRFQPISFHIIGSGKAEEKIKKLAEKLNLNVTFHGFVEPSKLPDLIQTMDIVFAMGTSALQAGHLGIATILVDYSEKRIKPGSYKFSWLCDQVVIGVGQDINMPYFKKSPVADLGSDLRKRGIECHEHVERYHGESANKKLVDALNGSTAPLSLVHQIKFIKPTQKVLYLGLSTIRNKILKIRSHYSYSFLKK